MKIIVLFIFLFIPILLFSQNKGTFTDNRDNKIYRWTKIGEQIWMAENLNYTTKISHYYNNDSLNSSGQLYDYQYERYDSIGDCPKGWYIPSVEDWNKLMNFVGKTFVANKLKSKTFKDGYDNFGLNVLPNGRYYLDGKNSKFENKNTHAYFWTSTERDRNSMWALFFYSDSYTISKFDGDKTNGLSFRCIKK